MFIFALLRCRTTSWKEHMNTKEVLAKLELIEVQARVTLSLAQEIRQMLTARPDLEATIEMPREALERKKAA
jgi:hypothetical protein